MFAYRTSTTSVFETKEAANHASHAVACRAVAFNESMQDEAVISGSSYEPDVSVGTCGKSDGLVMLTNYRAETDYESTRKDGEERFRGYAYRVVLEADEFDRVARRMGYIKQEEAEDYR